MNLFVTPEFKAAFSQQPPVGDWVIRKFYEWKSSGKTVPAVFGRDEADTRPNFSNLRHVHVMPSDPLEQVKWMRKAVAGVDSFNLTSDRFVLYAKHDISPSYLLIDYYIDPGAHGRLSKYYGDVQDNFAWSAKLPPGCFRFPLEKKIA